MLKLKIQKGQRAFVTLVPKTNLNAFYFLGFIDEADLEAL